MSVLGICGTCISDNGLYIFDREKDESDPFWLLQMSKLNEVSTATQAVAQTSSTSDAFFDKQAQFVIYYLDKGVYRGKVEFSILSDASDGPYCRVHWLCAPNHGALLLGACERVAEEVGANYIHLSFDAVPEDAQMTAKRMNFYAKQGYRVFFLVLTATPVMHCELEKRLDGARIDYEDRWLEFAKLPLEPRE